MAEQKRNKSYLLLLSENEKSTLQKAADKGGTIVSRLVREASLNEAKKILKQIEKGK